MDLIILILQAVKCMCGNLNEPQLSQTLQPPGKFFPSRLRFEHWLSGPHQRPSDIGCQLSAVCGPLLCHLLKPQEPPPPFKLLHNFAKEHSK